MTVDRWLASVAFDGNVDPAIERERGRLSTNVNVGTQKRSYNINGASLLEDYMSARAQLGG